MNSASVFMLHPPRFFIFRSRHLVFMPESVLFMQDSSFQFSLRRPGAVSSSICILAVVRFLGVEKMYGVGIVGARRSRKAARGEGREIEGDRGLYVQANVVHVLLGGRRVMSGQCLLI